MWLEIAQWVAMGVVVTLVAWLVYLVYDLTGHVRTTRGGLNLHLQNHNRPTALDPRLRAMGGDDDVE